VNATYNVTVTVIVNVQEAAPAVTPIRHGHRTPQETQLKLENTRQQQIAIQKRADRLQHKLRIAERLRGLFGDEVANSVMAGGS
jgi:hypothetical protein